MSKQSQKILRSLLVTGAVISGACSLGGCMQTENSSALDKISSFVPTGTNQFSAAREVFAQNCVPCHSYQGMSEAELVAMGLAVGGGNAEDSPIYYRLFNSSGELGPKNMPTSGALTTADINKIKAFVESIP